MEFGFLVFNENKSWLFRAILVENINDVILQKGYYTDLNFILQNIKRLADYQNNNFYYWPQKKFADVYKKVEDCLGFQLINMKFYQVPEVDQILPRVHHLQSHLCVQCGGHTIRSQTSYYEDDHPSCAVLNCFLYALFLQKVNQIPRFLFLNHSGMALPIPMNDGHDAYLHSIQKPFVWSEMLPTFQLLPLLDAII